jgi:hypothetical protein
MGRADRCVLRCAFYAIAVSMARYDPKLSRKASGSMLTDTKAQ